MDRSVKDVIFGVTKNMAVVLFFAVIRKCICSWILYYYQGASRLYSCNNYGNALNGQLFVTTMETLAVTSVNLVTIYISNRSGWICRK